MKLYGILLGLVALGTVACGGDDDDDGGGGSGASAGSTASGKGGTGSGKGGSDSGGSDSGGTTSSGGTTGAGCDPVEQVDMMASECPAYDECMQTACQAEYATCLGENYLEGDFSGGQCEGVFTCIQECDCEETCSQSCVLEDEACFGCFFTFVDCSADCEDELAACE